MRTNDQTVVPPAMMYSETVNSLSCNAKAACTIMDLIIFMKIITRLARRRELPMTIEWSSLIGVGCLGVAVIMIVVSYCRPSSRLRHGHALVASHMRRLRPGETL